MFKKERKRGKRVRTVYINMYIYVYWELLAAGCAVCISSRRDRNDTIGPQVSLLTHPERDGRVPRSWAPGPVLGSLASS
jgi:hypothetical protein